MTLNRDRLPAGAPGVDLPLEPPSHIRCVLLLQRHPSPWAFVTYQTLRIIGWLVPECLSTGGCFSMRQPGVGFIFPVGASPKARGSIDRPILEQTAEFLSLNWSTSWFKDSIEDTHYLRVVSIFVKVPEGLTQNVLDQKALRESFAITHLQDANGLP